MEEKGREKREGVGRGERLEREGRVSEIAESELGHYSIAGF